MKILNQSKLSAYLIGGADWYFERNNFEPNKEELRLEWNIQRKRGNPMVFVYFVEVELTDGDTKIFKGDVTVIK
ncbi:MAG: hypothetical protein IPL13_12280 [Saprospiraceae bacterium]|nr:hypothetical protein [Candidatus Brachybacter algidus]